MSKVQVYVSPTQSNQHIVAKLQRLPVAGLVDFLPLSRDVETRNNELRQVRGRAAFLWGDGTRHGESYHFTTNVGSLKLKANVDYHEDVIDFTTATDRPNFANHMRHTTKDGVRIIMALSDSERRAAEIVREMMFEATEYGPGEIVVTIDGDGLQSFPARKCWLFESGVNPQEVTALIRLLGERLIRLDAGGMVEHCPDFELVDPSVLHMFELRAFATHFEDLDERQVKTLDRAGVYPPSQDAINRIASYVTWFYADLLTAFADR